jgi:pantetheine-phosphate adenylyltransferase
MFARVAPAPIEVRWRREDELGSALALARACGGDASRGVAVRSSDDFATARALWKVYDVVSAIDPRREVYPVFEGRGGGDDVGTRGDAREDEEEDEETRDDDADAEVERAVRARVASWSAPNATTRDDGSDGTMDKVSVGGTFDRLHAGHRLLLASASRAVAGGGVLYVGVTSAELLANKAYGALVESYADRAANARAFLALCDPESSIEVRVGPLDASPPLAATVRDMSGLVVSRETAAGAEALNDMRSSGGLAPLRVVVVDLVRGGEGEELKLSSTRLRERDAAEG